MIKVKDKLIIDIEKLHKNKNTVLMDLNSSKLQSPVILIDPTYKQRNVLAALSYETFEKFKKACLDFIKKPSINSFEYKKIDLDKIKKTAMSSGCEFILIEASTDKQPGDIAGSKLLKFYKHLGEEIGKLFKIKNQDFNYNKDKAAKYFFVVNKKKEIILNGPKADDKENVLKFRKKHKTIFTKAKKIYAKEKIKFSLKQFIDYWKIKNKKKLEEMHVINLQVVDYS
jgi:tRNA nucleotidyltransferase (CCA-adding enzyme)